MRLGLTRLARRVTGVVSGLATSASVLTRTSLVSAYPPTISFTRSIDWQDGDKAVMQWSTDSTFGTGVTETTTPVTLTTAVTTYNFGLSAIVAGVVYMRLAAWRGTRPGSLNWSNLQGVGNAAVPTISSAATMADYQFAPGTLALTASMAATWAIVGGSGMAQFTVSGSTLSSLAQAATGTLIVQVQATSLFGVASAVQTITDTVAVNTPNAFPFTNQVLATNAVAYTSNTITVAGIVGGASMPVSIAGASGTYSKNGGAFVSAAGTAVNGDTFACKVTSATATDTTTLTIGATNSPYTVTTNASVSIAALTTTTGTSKNLSIAISGSPALTFTGGNQGTFMCDRATIQQSANYCQMELTVTTPSGFFGIGYDDGTLNFNGGYIAPGYSVGGGYALVWNVSTLAVNWNSGANSFQFSAAVTPTAGDVYTVRLNKSANTMDVWLTRSGTTTKQGGQATGLSALTAYYAYVAPRGVEVGTMNFGASAFSKALDLGAVSYG